MDLLAEARAGGAGVDLQLVHDLQPLRTGILHRAELNILYIKL